MLSGSEFGSHEVGKKSTDRDYVIIPLNKNGIPFHDRERITNFQKYHEKITAIFQIEKREGKYSNQKKENILIRKRKIFQLEKGKYSNEKKENIPITVRAPL